MIATLKLIPKGGRFPINLSIPISPDGMPILPSKGDWFKYDEKYYQVRDTIWDFSSEEMSRRTIMVYAEEGDPSAS